MDDHGFLAMCDEKRHVVRTELRLFWNVASGEAGKLQDEHVCVSVTRAFGLHQTVSASRRKRFSGNVLRGEMVIKSEPLICVC